MRFIIFLFVNMGLILLNAAVDMAILLYMSVSFFESDVMVHPRYLNMFSCFISTPSCVILQAGMLVLLEVTIHSVFFAFSSSPF